MTIDIEKLTKSRIERALREVLTDRLSNHNTHDDANNDDDDDVVAYVEETIQELAQDMMQNKISHGGNMFTSEQSLVNALGETLIDLGCCRGADDSDVKFVCQSIFEELSGEDRDGGDGDDDDEGYSSDREYGEGQCVLCEREMPLTFHHLIPRTTHKKVLRRTELTKKELNRGIMVCRPCHSAIHRFIDEETMAAQYNTLESLLEHERVQSWIPYAAKMKPVPRENAELYHQGKLRYRS